MLTRKAINDILIQSGIKQVATAKQVAEILKLSIHTIRAARQSGNLRHIDRDSFHIDDIIDWIMRNPRYITRLNDINVAN